MAKLASSPHTGRLACLLRALTSTFAVPDSTLFDTVSTAGPASGPTPPDDAGASLRLPKADDPLTQLGILTSGGHVKAEVHAITAELLATTGLEPVANRLAGEISTGQGRLVELARALARRPRIPLLDEPPSGLDVKESEA
jgi:ABC-type sugar transport system ATPase subunit